MGKKTAKSTKKFIASGQLKKTITARRKQQQVRKRISGRRGAKSGNPKSTPADEDADDGVEESPKVVKPRSSKSKPTTVDDILAGGFMDDSEGEDEDGEEMYAESAEESSDADEDAEDDIGNEGSFSDVDDLDSEGEVHLHELSKLAEKDPEFYKYLQENDKELLDFDPSAHLDVDMDGDDEDEGDEDMDGQETEERLPILTMKTLTQWQKVLLQQRSLRSLRKLLVAFRSAVHMNEEGQVLAWSIDSAKVYNKLVTTSLRYTPVILEHHVPYKTLPDGRFKPPVQTKKFKTLQKLILSYFQNVIHLLSQSTDEELLELAVKESSKLIPYIITSRKTVKLYLKKCLELWSSSQDSVRIASVLAMRKLSSSSDQSILANVQKGIYLTLVRSTKLTSAHTLPAITLMKNSASEIFCLDHGSAYQHAFGYIRQLAIHLRNSMKIKTKEAYKQVYNWQFVHCIDFWSIVLARACDVRSNAEGSDNELKALIYPLVQVSLGSIKLISSSRCYPFHFHIIRSLLRLTQHTDTYVPLAPYIVPILTATLTGPRPKSSTLKPLDFEVQIRAPQQYLKTRVYTEGLVEEATFLLADWLATRVIQGSVAFPEIVVPIVVSVRKSLKAGKNASGKDVTAVKVLVERIEDAARWVDQKRKSLPFAPGNVSKVEEWESGVRAKIEETPMAKYAKILKKTREKRRKLIEKARKGEDEILEEE
ncbi:hypothetical protein CCMSSC00406_0003539 [Pleurotus cornucopiae]|uniref:Uncharacterized protein n=1 Tax=Pleurotus cornucopiae TaxID=5321 RepID=A0ACB7IHN8_PLECO|nr:hypothetical protein CCMSSC00406_0003539 [Pleurotus cornucopiae]